MFLFVIQKNLKKILKIIFVFYIFYYIVKSMTVSTQYLHAEKLFTIGNSNVIGYIC